MCSSGLLKQLLFSVLKQLRRDYEIYISCVHFLQGGNRGLRGILEEREDDKHLSVHNGARTTGIMYH